MSEQTYKYDWRLMGKVKELIIKPIESIPADGGYEWQHYWAGKRYEDQAKNQEKDYWFAATAFSAHKVIYKDGEPYLTVVVDQINSGQGLHRMTEYSAHVEDLQGKAVLTPEAELVLEKSLQGIFQLPSRQ